MQNRIGEPVESCNTVEQAMANEEQLAILRQGVEDWNTWRAYNAEAEIDLSGADLSRSNCSRGDFTGANLSGADLSMADLSQAYLSEANLAGADLSAARLAGAYLCFARLMGAYLNLAKLNGADLRCADLTGADLRGSNLSEANVTGVSYNRKSMCGKYLGIRVDSCYGDAVFKRDAQDQDYIDTFVGRNRWEKGKRWGYIWCKIWGLFDYGRSIPRVGIFAFLLIMMFGTVYRHYPWLVSQNCTNPITTWFTPYYYSIVIFTTLGFGDLTARHLAGETLVSLEVVFGYVTLGMLLAILANKVARRS